MSEQVKWVKVYECLNLDRAYLLRSYLQSHGVEVMLQGVGTGGLFPGTDFAKVPVLVKEPDEEKAKELIDEFFKPSC